MNLSTAFFGSSVYVGPLLETLRSCTQLKLVVTQPDKPVGRRQELSASFPKKWAESQSVQVLTPTNLIAESNYIREKFLVNKIDLAIVADYGLLIPPEIFSLPRWKTINIHFSKLPDLAGPSPVQWTILRGDKEAWISFFLLADELDAGPILYQKGVPLQGKMTTGQLYQELFVKASELLPEVLSKFTQGSLKPYPQDKSKTTYTRRLTRDDGFVPFTIIAKALEGKDDKEWKTNFFLTPHYPSLSTRIDRMLRAFTPWPGVWTTISSKGQVVRDKGLRLKILKAHAEGERLVLDEVQFEGKKPTPWKEIQKANPDIF